MALYQCPEEGETPKQLEPPSKNPPQIVLTLRKDRNHGASLDLMGGPVVRLDFLRPLILKSIQLTISPK